MVNLAYAGGAERNNTKGLLFKATLTGNYGVNGVGDLLNLLPVSAANPGGITDPEASYDIILAEVPKNIAVLNESIGGYYCAVKPNANPTLQNFGLQVFAPGGAELATGAAYAAAVLAGFVLLEVFVPLQ